MEAPVLGSDATTAHVGAVVGHASSDSPTVAGRTDSYSGVATVGTLEGLVFPWQTCGGDDLMSEEAKEASKVRQLLSLIKRRELASGDNRVIIPTNFFLAVPLLAWKLQGMAERLSVILVSDPDVHMPGTMAKALSMKEEERLTFLSDLKAREGTDEYEGICALFALCELCDALPAASSVEKLTGGAKVAMRFFSSLVAGIWCEVECDAPLSESAKWWQNGGADKISLITLLGNLWQSQAAAKGFVAAYEIVVRKQIRKAMSLPRDMADVVTRFQEIARAHIEMMTATAGTMFLRQLRPTTVEVWQNVPDVKSKRPGAMRKEKVLKKGFLRPSLLKGPGTPWETATAGRINAALGKIESGMKNFRFKNVRSPKEWASDIGKVVERLYNFTAPYSKLIASRKREVRSLCLAGPPTNSQGQQGAASGTPVTRVIAPSQWEQCSAALAKERGDQWEAEFLEQIRILLRSPHLTKDGLSLMSESAIWGRIWCALSEL